MHFYVERYKSNEFIKIYRVWHENGKKIWLENKKPNFSGFLGFFKKNLGFLKRVASTAIFTSIAGIIWLIILHVLSSGVYECNSQELSLQETFL